MAKHATRWGKIVARAGAALLLLGLTGLGGSLDQVARRWSDFFCICLRVAMETLPSLAQGAWQISELYLLGHLRVPEGLLPITGACWQVVLTLARVA